MTTSITFRGSEVHNPVARILIACVVIPIGLVIGLAVLLLLITLSPAIVALHFLLKACGRQGFVTRTTTTLNVNVGLNGFRRR